MRRIWAAAAAMAVLANGAAAAPRDPRVIPMAAVDPASEPAIATGSRTAPEPRPAPEPRVTGFEARPNPPVQGALTVHVDRAKIIRLPEKTQSVIIGNPAVADITVQKSGVVVLTGKSFGVTNFIAIDPAGNQLAESKISVTAPTDSTLLVQRGLDRQTYSCSPVCLPTVALGDSSGFFGEIRGQADAHSAFIGQR